MKTDRNLEQELWEKEIACLQSVSRGLFGENKKPESLYTPCSYVMQPGGKYLRPLLFLLTFKIVGGRKKPCYHTALAIEMLHRASLVFDDIMDGSHIRHNREALHEKVGMNNALLTGICLLPFSYETIATHVPRDKVVQSFRILNKALLDMNEGQATDMDTQTCLTLEDYDRMIYKKTASLIEASCKLGAYLASASRKEINALSDYGKHLGMAFQVRDDLLDLLGNQEELGKPTGRDTDGGKRTYMRVRAMEKGKEYEQKVVGLEQRKKDMSPDHLLMVYREVYTEGGVVEDAKRKIEFHIDVARKSLAVFPDSQQKELLNFIAGYVVAKI